MAAKVTTVEVKAQPPLKWVGGKRSLLPELLKRVPKKIGTYFEPFFGGGALYFALAGEEKQRFKDAMLSDLNHRLIWTFQGILANAPRVIELLDGHAQKHSKSYYESMRAFDIDRTNDKASIAAWMIYLNRTCFNGLYRVNRSGRFNVPIGNYVNPTICDRENLMLVSKALNPAVVTHMAFERAVKTAKKGDFVYFDPPYLPISKTSNFTSYTEFAFGVKEHTQLRDVALELKKKGVSVLVSNSSADAIRELYKEGFTVEEVQAARNVNSKGDKRGKITDLVIT